MQSLRDVLRRLRKEDGIALIMAVGILGVLTIAGTTVIVYSSSNARTASYSETNDTAYRLAEAGMAHALSRLHNALDPRTASLLPSTTITQEGGTATYSGTLAGDVWTITSTGKAKNPATGSGDIQRKLTRTVQIYGINAGATVSAWSRIYHDSTASCLSVSVTIPASVGARGSLCFTGSGTITETPRADTTTKVAVGSNVTLGASNSIGVSGTNVERADIGGNCNGTTCNSAQRVYANTITTAPTDLAKPYVDFAYWYTNANPGPLNNCDVGSFPGGFDNGGGYNNSRGTVEIAGITTYTCQATDGSGNVIGELSWNNSTKVLKIKGTIFIDGRVTLMTDTGGLINYQGRGTIYAADQFEIDGKVCAGGSGTTNCRTAGMSSWDPTTNMLVLAGGDKQTAGDTTLQFGDNGPADPAFQGVLWAKYGCDVFRSTWLSGPIICDTFSISSTAGFYEWPPLGSLLPGQVYGSTSTSTDFLLSVGTEAG